MIRPIAAFRVNHYVGFPYRRNMPRKAVSTQDGAERTQELRSDRTSDTLREPRTKASQARLEITCGTGVAQILGLTSTMYEALRDHETGARRKIWGETQTRCCLTPGLRRRQHQLVRTSRGGNALWRFALPRRGNALWRFALPSFSFARSDVISQVVASIAKRHTPLHCPLACRWELPRATRLRQSAQYVRDVIGYSRSVLQESGDIELSPYVQCHLPGNSVRP